MATPPSTASQPPTSNLAPAPVPNSNLSLADGNPFSTTNGPALTSATDTGLSTRPRDTRTIHVVLASLGVSAYQERVPLQLLDFAYRYTAGILSDAQHLAAEGYIAAPLAIGNASGRGKGAAAGGNADDGGVSLAALRLATASRNGYQFSSGLPKETLLEMAAEKNKVRLPEVHKDIVFGVRLPHERFVMTGTGWNMLEEWDSEVEETPDESSKQNVNGGHHVDGETNGINGHGKTQTQNAEAEDEDMGDDDGFQDVFGGDDQGDGEGNQGEQENGMEE